MVRIGIEASERIGLACEAEAVAESGTSIFLGFCLPGERPRTSPNVYE
jgi:hypothetical protein